jgi:hypothetical protein
MADTTESPRPRLRVAGTALLFLGALMFLGSFVAASKTPTFTTSCTGQGPCDGGTNSSHRESVFYRWIGATLLIVIGGVVLRSVAHRAD